MEVLSKLKQLIKSTEGATIKFQGFENSSKSNNRERGIIRYSRVREI